MSDGVRGAVVAQGGRRAATLFAPLDFPRCRVHQPPPKEVVRTAFETRPSPAYEGPTKAGTP